MTDQRPPAPTLRRRFALATKGARLAIANGVAGALGLKLKAYEPERPPADLTPKPARVPPARPAQPSAAAAPAAPAAPPPPTQPAPRPAAAAPEPVRPDAWFPETGMWVDACTVCGDPLAELVKDDYCPSCNSPARTRVLSPLLDEVIGPAAGVPRDLPLLGFAMAGVERKLLAPHFPNVKSVSLFGEYGKEHELGVDARDLTRYPDQAFCGHFSILLFDYFTEQKQGIEEAYRLLAPGGVFFTQLGPYRLLDGWSEPRQVKEVRGRPGYFEYLPEGVALADIRVGRQWFLQAMHDTGFETRWIRIRDRASDRELDWFVGFKPAN